MTNLVEAFNGIVDGYYYGSVDFNRVLNALENYERIIDVLKNEQYNLDAIHRIRDITGIEIL